MSNTLPPHRRLSWLKCIELVGLPLLLTVSLWGGATLFFSDLRETLNPPPAAAEPQPADGARLFAQNCAYCHGERGDGNGIASLSVKARYFGAEPYKFTDTVGTKIPTDDALTATLRRGIAGSSMPSFKHLRDDELQALVGHLRTLTRKGLYEQLTRKALKEADEGGDDPNPTAIAAKVDDLCKVGTPLAVPKDFRPSDASSIAAGRTLFLAQCATCHGPEGLGNGAQVKDLKNDNGTPAHPRNLSTGVFKGGKDKQYLYARLVVGIPGTPMPALPPNAPPADAADLINYVLSLSGG